MINRDFTQEFTFDTTKLAEALLKYTNEAFAQHIDTLAKTICESLVDAIHNREIAMANLDSRNSAPACFWDNYYTLIKEKLNTDYCKPFMTKVGSWDFTLVTVDGIVVTFMKEKRFRLLQKNLSKNSACTHYAVCLARTLNADIPSLEIPLLDVPNNDILSKSETLVSKVLRTPYERNEIIKRFAMILFEEHNNIITQVRLVIVDANLEVRFEVKFNYYLPMWNNCIADKVDTFDKLLADNNQDNPVKRIALKANALALKGKSNLDINIKTEKEFNLEDESP